MKKTKPRTTQQRFKFVILSSIVVTISYQSACQSRATERHYFLLPQGEVIPCEWMAVHECGVMLYGCGDDKVPLRCVPDVKDLGPAAEWSEDE